MDFTSYREQFLKNLKVMSRTANNVLDLSASAGKADAMATTDANTAKKLVDENIEKTLVLIYEKRYHEFLSKEELSNFLIQIAESVNRGIVKPGMLFRSGSDSEKFLYAKIADLEELWDWFCGELFSMLTATGNNPVRVAAFAEYFINQRGHFFSDGCGKISILVSSFVLLRNEMNLPEYRSRDEYFAAGDPKSRPTPQQPMEEEIFEDFLEYYKSLFTCKVRNLYITKEPAMEGIHAEISGYLTAEIVPYFRKKMLELFAEHPGEELILYAKGLVFLSAAGIEQIRELFQTHGRILFEEPSQLCFMSLHLAGMDDYALKYKRIPEIDPSGCERLGGGANADVYLYNEDMILKVFKNDPDTDELFLESNMMRELFFLGIPCPISFGVVLSGGKPALLYEMTDAKSFRKLLQEDPGAVEQNMPAYTALIRKMHSIRGAALQPFPKNLLLKEILQKAERLKDVIGEEYVGLAKQLIVSIKEPEVLLHGDIQPANVMFGKNGVSFIDFDTIASGFPILEIGNLRRTLFCDWEFNGETDNYFLNLSAETCRTFWESFVKTYYQDTEADVFRDKMRTAEIVSEILFLAKEIKSRKCIVAIENGTQRLQKLLDEWNLERR